LARGPACQGQPDRYSIQKYLGDATDGPDRCIKNFSMKDFIVNQCDAFLDLSQEFSRSLKCSSFYP
jgi:hypothetical protein